VTFHFLGYECGGQRHKQRGGCFRARYMSREWLPEDTARDAACFHLFAGIKANAESTSADDTPWPIHHIPFPSHHLDRHRQATTGLFLRDTARERLGCPHPRNKCNRIGFTSCGKSNRSRFWVAQSAPVLPKSCAKRPFSVAYETYTLLTNRLLPL